MKDDEIIQLNVLMRDRDELTSFLERIPQYMLKEYLKNKNPYSPEEAFDRKSKKGFFRFFKNDVKIKLRKIEDDNTDVELPRDCLSVEDFNNDVVQKRIRDIQQKIMILMQEEIKQIYIEIEKALRDYKGGSIIKYVKNRVLLTEK